MDADDFPVASCIFAEDGTAALPALGSDGVVDDVVIDAVDLAKTDFPVDLHIGKLDFRARVADNRDLLWAVTDLLDILDLDEVGDGQILL